MALKIYLLGSPHRESLGELPGVHTFSYSPEIQGYFHEKNKILLAKKIYLLGSPTGDPGALPGDDTEERGDLFPIVIVFSLQRLQNKIIFNVNGKCKNKENYQGLAAACKLQ